MLWQIRDVRPLERWEEGEQHLGKDRGRERVRKPVLRKKGDGDQVRGKDGGPGCRWEVHAAIRALRLMLSVSGSHRGCRCWVLALQPLSLASSSCWAEWWGSLATSPTAFERWDLSFQKGNLGSESHIPHPKPVKAELLWLPSAQPLAPSCCVGSSVAPQWGFHWPQLGKYFS